MMSFVLLSRVVAPRPSRSFSLSLYGLRTSSHPTICFSDDSALTCTTADRQLFWNQSSPHSFHSEGSTPSSRSGTHLTLRICLSFHALTNCKFRIPFVLIFIQIARGCTPGRSPISTVHLSTNRGPSPPRR